MVPNFSDTAVPNYSFLGGASIFFFGTSKKMDVQKYFLGCTNKLELYPTFQTPQYPIQESVVVKTEE